MQVICNSLKQQQKQTAMCSYQSDKAEASVSVDEHFIRLAIFEEQLSEVVLGNVSGKITDKQSAPLCECFLPRFPEALQVYSHLPRLAAAFCLRLRTRHFRRWRRSLHLLHALRGRRLRVAVGILRLWGCRAVLDVYMLQVSVCHLDCGVLR